MSKNKRCAYGFTCMREATHTSRGARYCETHFHELKQRDKEKRQA